MKEILEQVEFLFKQYSTERRAMTQPYLLKAIQQHYPEYTYNPHDNIVRETLMEHVGSLPVLAIALYPHIDDPEVNLGEAMTMLAIHDIGELLLGDENTFTKNDSGKQAEYEAGLKLLHPSYHTLYADVENRRSKTAQFAKAIDKITPDVFDYLTPPEATKARFKILLEKEPEEIVPLIVKHKRPYMEWNPFMTEFHDYLMQQLRQKLGTP
ncbi:MAG: HD domain-containing protein [Candidatus Doudnabacteria bacterium]|nr:HD domain-containing protein [Candidatus Doudnabacteria bacterium]